MSEPAAGVVAQAASNAVDQVDAIRFRRNAILMVIGSVGSQGLVFAAIPVLSRIYSAEAIGLQALLVSAAGTLAVLASVRFDLAAVLPRREREAHEIAVLVVCQGIAFGVFVAITAALAERPLQQFFSPDVSSPTWLFLLGPMVAMSTAFSALQGLATRRGAFKAIVLSNVGLSGGFVVLSCALGLVGSPESGPVYGRFVGQALALAFIVGALHVAWQTDVLRTALVHARRYWREYRQFILFNTPYSFIGQVTRDLPLYMFSVSGAVTATAAYALARAVTLAPTALVSSAVSRVFYREAALHLGKPELERLATTLTRNGLWISVGGFAYLLVYGDRFFELLLGSTWTTAGEFSQRLAIPMWLALQTGWPERLFEVTRRQRTSFTIQIVFDAIHATLLVTTYAWTGDAMLAVTVFAISLSGYHVVYLIAVYRVAGFDLRPLVRSLLGSALAFAIATACFVVVRRELGTGTGTAAVMLGIVLVATAGAAVASNLRRRLRSRKN